MIQRWEGEWEHLQTLPSSALLSWVQDKLPWEAGWGAMRRMCTAHERHCTQAAASEMSWSLWFWACPSHSNEQRMCMCRLREAHPQGPGKDNQVSCLLSYACCQSFLGFHGNWLLQKWCYENDFWDLKLTDLLCSNRSRETHHCIALPACGVKAVLEKLQVPQDSLHHLPCATDPSRGGGGGEGGEGRSRKEGAVRSP